MHGKNTFKIIHVPWPGSELQYLLPMNKRFYRAGFHR